MTAPDPARGWEAFIEGHPAVPYAFIQWKGTQVCMDWYCPCGAQSHVDDDFAYYVECPECHVRFEVGCFMALRPTTAAPETNAFAMSHEDSIKAAYDAGSKRGYTEGYRSGTVDGQAAGVAQERERLYDCTTCRLPIFLDVKERDTIMCPDCKTYTAHRRPPRAAEA